MLVVTRKLNQGVIIDDNIQVVVLGIEDGKVKLGIEAPKEKKIYRKEIYDAIMKENQKAMQVDKDVLSYLINRREED